MAAARSSTPPVASPLPLLLIDIDHFEDFNDRFGHGEGDRMLKRIALDIMVERAHLGLHLPLRR